MAHVFPTGNYNSTAFNLAGAGQTTIYTCPAGMRAAYIVGLWAADDAGAARTLTVEWTDDSAAATFVLVFQKAIAANVEIFIEFPPLVIDPNDTIKLTGSAAGIHGFITVQEIGRGS